MKCNKCGVALQEDVLICPNCGNNINDQKIENVIHSEQKFQITRFSLAAFFIMIGCLVVYSVFFTMSISVEGTWKCADYDSDFDVNEDLNYYFEMEFKKDYSFRYDTYDNAAYDNHMKGTYSIEDHSRANDSRYLGIQQVYYIPSEIVRNGEKSISKSTSSFEFDFIEKNLALVIDLKNSSSYVCKK